MQKQTMIALIIGIIIIIGASLFIFGLVPASPSTSSTSATPTAQTTTQPAGKLKVEDQTVGNGREVKSGDTVQIKYTGKLTNGKVFDSTDAHGGQPYETQIGVGQVIKGWDEGVVGMKVGGKRRLTIPPDLGYGSQTTGSIPPNSTLIFDVELIGIK